METLDFVQSDYELERGKPMPSWNHALLQSNLIFLLRLRYNQTHTFLSELSLRWEQADQKTVPDVTIYARPPHYLAADQITVSEVPDTTIEILSPTQGLAELTDKVEYYLTAGVKSCWIVLPGFRSVVVSTELGVYQTFDQRETLHDPATGIELELAPLFS